MKRSIDANGGVVSYTNDAYANVASQTDAETGLATTYVYNGIGWLLSKKTPTVLTITYY